MIKLVLCHGRKTPLNKTAMRNNTTKEKVQKAVENKVLIDSLYNYLINRLSKTKSSRLLIKLK